MPALPPLPAPQAALVAAFSAHCRAVHGLAAKTARNYAYAAHQFLLWWGSSAGDAPLADVRTRDLAEFFVAEQQRGLAARSRYGMVYGIKSFFAFLVADERLAASPAGALPAPRLPPAPVEVYSPAEAATILAHTATLADVRGRQRHALTATFASTGIRAGEAEQLRRDDVDLDARHLRVTGKGDKQRLVPIPPVLADTLRGFLDDVRPQLPDSPFLFANPHACVVDPHRRMSNYALGKEVELAGAGAQVPGRHFPHKWRHTYATQLLRAGVDVSLVQRLLGHASIVSTTLYLHLRLDELAAAVDDAFAD